MKLMLSTLMLRLLKMLLRWKSVDVMAGADAATCGRPLIEVIDEGQVDLSSDGIGSFEDSSSSSSFTPIFSDPPSDFSDAMDESDSPPPGYGLSSFSSPSFWSSWVSL